ncbi:hypothetical protein HHK36_016988 [Tetracentron sinense]|uniref:Uncharacterized protein n=1 Tax=Tetracentron sinense TaxID=13715 RepID=A0A834Z6B7_TETSI|nr:hypothetical protein HHK36_016988 [Tetracentron sinense]
MLTGKKYISFYSTIANVRSVEGVKLQYIYICCSSSYSKSAFQFQVLSAMAEDEEVENRNLLFEPPLRLPPKFLEVACKSSGKIRRFAAATEAGFALFLINRKLDFGVPLALHIEAIKEGEEPVSFGPHSVLVDYGDGWKLQTVMDEGLEKGKKIHLTPKEYPTGMSSDGLHPEKRSTEESNRNISFFYIGKILLAFTLIFLLGGMLTLVLENLPRLILLITSSM